MLTADSKWPSSSRGLSLACSQDGNPRVEVGAVAAKVTVPSGSHVMDLGLAAMGVQEAAEPPIPAEPPGDLPQP